MTAYPTGTVAFLFTDIEGSTRRWEAQQQAMWAAVERHFDLLRSAISAHGGVLFKTVGDAVQAAFPTVPDAIAAAIDAQHALHLADWGGLGPLRVRMAIHVGEASPRDGDYLAPALNRLARVLSVGYGDQVLLTEAAMTVARSALTDGVDVLDLGAHRLRDLLQSEHIYQLRGPGLAAEFPPLKSLDRHLHNLPAQPTALLGRESELAAVRALLQQDGVRIVTLTGPGGTGKTRLGIQTGAELLESFPDGVWFVPLAAIADPDLVIPAIAQPFGVRENPDESLLKTLQDYLQPRQALLLLDNFEHVTGAAADVALLLASCPKLKVLATSREPLRIAGEREMAVPPLSLPTARQARRLAAAELLEFSAIRLFVERAQSVKPDFALTDANGPDVAAICLRLDGLPLAIELAAARIRILPPTQLLARLDNRLKLLTGGARDLPARQQTLRAAIAWSHDLLDADEQTLFARLSVFAGGCTLEAAEAACAEVEGVAVDVLDGLESLLQKSLARRTESLDDEPRYFLLETIREFGLERLEQLADAESVRRAHARYFLDLAERAEPELTEPDQVRWLNLLEDDHDNFRASLAWFDHGGNREQRLRLASALWRFWWVRGHLGEGRRWLEQALTGSGGLDPELLARSFSRAGVLAESQGDFERASTFHEDALSRWKELGNRLGIATTLTDLGIIARIRGNLTVATELQTNALSIWEQLGDDLGIIGSLHELGLLALDKGDYRQAEEQLQNTLAMARNLGDAAAIAPVLESLGILSFYQEQYEQAGRLYQESLELWRLQDDSRMVALLSGNLGEIALVQRDMARAECLFEEALALSRDLGDKRGTAFALRQLGKVAMERGDLARARASLRESLQLQQQVGEQSSLIEGLEAMASLAMRQGCPSVSAQLLGATEMLRSTLEITASPHLVAERSTLTAQTRSTLGESPYTQDVSSGRNLSLDQAIGAAMTLYAQSSSVISS